MSDLPRKLLAVHEGLDGAGIPHAFGGAIALAYYTGDPRPTRDLDVNVFLGPDQARRVVDALPNGTRVRPRDIEVLQHDGQARLWWDDTPIDLFLDTDAFHHEAAARVRVVSFGDTEIPVLDGVTLAVFKAFFNRTKDWVDIGEMVGAGELDVAAAVRWLEELLGPDDEVTRRLAGFVS